MVPLEIKHFLVQNMDLEDEVLILMVVMILVIQPQVAVMDTFFYYGDLNN